MAGEEGVGKGWFHRRLRVSEGVRPILNSILHPDGHDSSSCSRVFDLASEASLSSICCVDSAAMTLRYVTNLHKRWYQETLLPTMLKIGMSSWLYDLVFSLSSSLFPASHVSNKRYYNAEKVSFPQNALHSWANKYTYIHVFREN